MVDKQKLKEKITNKVGELIDATDKVGNINFFEINIKHSENQLMVELKNKYKEKV